MQSYFKNNDNFFCSSFIQGIHINVFLHTCIIVSSEPEAESWDFGMIIGVVAMAILLTLTASLLVVFIFD